MHPMNEVSTEEKIPLSQTSLEFHVALVAQTVKNLPAMQEIWVRSVDQEDALEKGLATHSSNLACRISRTEDPAGLQPMGSQELDTTEQLALSHFGRFLRQLRFCLGNYSGISSLVVVKVSKADLLSRGQKEIQQISEESLNQLEWKETKLAREQDHGMPRARERSHRRQPPVSRANSTRCQGTLTRRPQEKRTSSLRASFFRVTLQLWKVARSLQIPKQHFRKEMREGEVLEETERFNPINSPCYLRELFNWTKFEMDFVSWGLKRRPNLLEIK